MLRVLRYAALSSLVATAISNAAAQRNDATQYASKAFNETSVVTTTVFSETTSFTTLSLVSNATCTSRTVNYITHTLPQQCLRTDRGLFNSTRATNHDNQEYDVTQRTPWFTFNEKTASTPAGTGQPLIITEVASRTTTGLASEASEHTSYTLDPSDISETPSASSLIAESEVVVRKEPEPELESPLDNANFLSFEEWKKQNLARVGQSAEHVGQARHASGDRQRPGINNALDALGEESEIDIDFAGFGSPRPSVSTTIQASSDVSEYDKEAQVSPAPNTLRSKDAGKTCKERTNYASFDCAATILKSNPECKHSSSILVENKDSYLLNPCSASNKFLVVELCNDILIDTVVLANYEFFSSIFHYFRVSVSDRYPVKAEKWRELGTFEARNTREVQAFLVKEPLIWARYLRVEFLSHYGMEYYCPLSLLRVHGTTMMEEFRHQEEVARGEIDEAPLEAEESSWSTIDRDSMVSSEEADKAIVQSRASVKTDSASETTITPFTEVASPGPPILHGTGIAPGSPPDAETMNEAPSLVEVDKPVSDETTSELAYRATDGGNSHEPENGTVYSTVTASLSQDSSGSTLNATPSSADSVTPPSPTSATNETAKGPPVATGTVSSSMAAGNAINSSAPISHPATDSQMSTSTNSSARLANASSNSTRAVSSSTAASHQPQPSTQESFFKSVHKRLQQLESNSTLSLQYIEEQSRILRDAFQKVEKRQISATTTFLTQLNDTVTAELHGFRESYDQLWQSTVIELEGQREAYQREMLALSTRLSLVAEELVWQKRMGVVQSTLLLLCLGLILFGRQGSGHLEVPLAQQLMLKSQAALRSGWESEPDSPSPISRSPVSLFRRKIWRSSIEPPAEPAGDLTDATESRPDTRDGGDRALDVNVQPPTPTVDGDESETEDEESEEDLFEDVLTTQSGPATPNGTGAGLKRVPNERPS
ncbi:hypothetical protein B0A50_03328 [Salinomyces thailandicus]|uniref:SUN domain-containing protein n=1 Tax=Salinomyces thailandicus TaxID=706561 RepID=A0A4U0U260_9PEZI|nr:hypothetical protein B0A50_03328 [Salinomyces thailandica]